MGVWLLSILKLLSPVDQKPRSITSPLPKDGSTPNITAKRYMNSIPITNVGRDTPRRDTANIKSLKKPFLLIPV